MSRYRYEFCDEPPCAAKRSRKRTKNVNLETGFWRCWRCRAEGRVDVGQIRRPRTHRDDSRYIDRILATAQPLEGSVAERYLRKRGFGPPWPRDLLGHAALRHSPSEQDLPAMVGVVRDFRGVTVGVHRTYLAADGSKAPVEPVRMALGKVHGGAIRIDPAVGPWDGTVGVVEGIEDALGLRMLRPSWWVWAALTAGGVEALVLPPELRRVVIGPDIDANGVGQRSAAALELRLRGEHRQVMVLLPPGHDFGEVGSVRSPQSGVGGVQGRVVTPNVRKRASRY